MERLSRSSIGAIIAIEREVSLEEYVQSGSEMNAKVSADLLATIFTPYSPLHDGAVLIRGDTIIGAGCILPLSQSALLDRSVIVTTWASAASARPAIVRRATRKCACSGSCR